MNLLQKFEQTQIKKHAEHVKIAEFNVGDTVIVNIKVVEGTRERIQLFKGVCISRKHAGINSSFTVRKISYDEGVESSFPFYSPRIESVEVVRHGAVRRSKLYYLRNLRGKAARITERADYTPVAEAPKAAPAAAPSDASA